MSLEGKSTRVLVEAIAKPEPQQVPAPEPPKQPEPAAQR
jgi:hypothetical protein